MEMEKTINTEEIRPPDPPGALKWLRENFFNSWFNSLLSVVLIPGTIWVVYRLIKWIFLEADWTPVVLSPLLFAVGQYPRAELWRVALGLAWVLALIGISWGRWGGILRTIALGAAGLFGLLALLPVEHKDLRLVLYQFDQFDLTVRLYLGASALLVLAGFALSRYKKIPSWVILTLWVLSPFLLVAIISGFGNNELLPAVSTTLWGGLLVTLLLAVGGIVLSFPIGVLLALGRRSNLPVVKVFSTVFIEAVRGVPLVTILFMFQFILGLLLPPDAQIDRIIRALMAVTLFSAAYTAENVRGGLQAVPDGQVEAAQAVGMSGWKIMTFIVLPQAIRAILPAIVGQFIALFKDTTLVVIVGINDFLGMGRTVIKSDPAFFQRELEMYLFIAVVYMIFSYLMSMASQRLEITLGVQHG